MHGPISQAGRKIMRSDTMLKAILRFLFQLLIFTSLSTQAEPQSVPPAEKKPTGVPRFGDYPVEVWSGSPAPVAISTPDERLYRTQIRSATKHPPNFAGHYSVVIWGCGSGCLRSAVVDLQNGKVFSPPVTEDSQEEDGGRWWVSGEFTFEPPPIITRANSRLLILRRRAVEQYYPPEVFYFVWEDEKFKLVMHTIGGRKVSAVAKPLNSSLPPQSSPSNSPPQASPLINKSENFLVSVEKRTSKKQLPPSVIITSSFIQFSSIVGILVSQRKRRTICL